MTTDTIDQAFAAGKAHAERTDLPAGHNALKYASDKYPASDALFEAFMQGWDTIKARV